MIWPWNSGAALLSCAPALAANVAQDSTQFDLFVGGDLHEAEKELSRFEAGIDAAYALARAKDMITGSTNNYAYYFENGLSPTHLPHFAMPV